MPRTFNLEAAVTPSVDERAVEREASKTRQTFDEELSDIAVDTDVGGVAGAGAGGGGIGGVGGAGAAAAAGSRLGGAGLAGAAGGAAKAALPVALAGATAFGIKQGIDRLAAASPALQAQSSQFSEAMDLFFRPFGNALADQAGPLVNGLVDMAINFNEAYENGSLSVALSETFGPDQQEQFAFDLGEMVGDFLDNNKGKIVNQIIDSYELIFLGIFSEQGQQLIDVLESFASGVVGVDIGAKVQGLANSIANSWPGWNDLIDSVSLASFVTPVALPTFVTGVTLSKFVDPVDLPEFVDPVDLPEFVDPVDLPEFVTDVNLPSFVTDVNLPSFVTDVNLPSFVTDVNLSSDEFVNGVNLPEFVDGVNLGNFIDIPDFLRDGDPSGDPPDPDPPPNDSDDDPSAPGDGGGGGSVGTPGDPTDPAPPNDSDDDDDDNFADKPNLTPPSERGKDFPQVQSGGFVSSAGTALVHDGERVLPPSQVTDRGEADLAQGDRIVRLLQQIRSDLRRQDSGRDETIVSELRALRQAMDADGRSVREKDVVAALQRLFDRQGASL